MAYLPPEQDKLEETLRRRSMTTSGSKRNRDIDFSDLFVLYEFIPRVFL
ncbi:MAG: hypothetical protein ACOC4M_18205 [Promethearchaeia archaeon]